MGFNSAFKELNVELNPICHLLALFEAHHIFHVSRVWVKSKVEWFHLRNLAVCCFLGAGRSHSIKTGSSPFERVEEFK